MRRQRQDSQFDLSDLIGGKLSIGGLTLDIGGLLDGAERLPDQLERLRQTLVAAGGKPVLGDDEWRAGGISISGHIRTRGILGDREYHLGTRGRAAADTSRPDTPPVEPPTDVFCDDGSVTVVCEVPGVEAADLAVSLAGSTVTIASRAGAARSYRKTVENLPAVDPGTLSHSVRNGILEIRLSRAGES